MTNEMDREWTEHYSGKKYEQRRKERSTHRPFGTVSAQERDAILARWDEARAAHSRECAIFTRVKQSLPPRDRRNQSQIVMYELALQRYKAACAAYYQERDLMTASMYQSPKAAAIDDVVQQLKDIIQGIPTFDVPTAAELKKRDQVRDAIAATGDFDTIRQAALQHSVLSNPALEVTDELEEFETPADALVPATPEAPQSEELTPEQLIERFGIPEHKE